jgi:hypothetical protein
LLRHYLEFISAEICHRLRAPVEFRGDAQYQLGDMLQPAIGKLNALLREGKARKRVAATNADKWQINPAVHYNEWATLTRQDFAPVVKAYQLVKSFSCPNPRPARARREGRGEMRLQRYEY